MLYVCVPAVVRWWDPSLNPASTSECGFIVAQPPNHQHTHIHHTTRSRQSNCKYCYHVHSVRKCTSYYCKGCSAPLCKGCWTKWHTWLKTSQVWSSTLVCDYMSDLCVSCCLSLFFYADRVDKQHDTESKEKIDFSLMQSGAWVWIKYHTTQPTSRHGCNWRRVQVHRYGHVSETSYGQNITDPRRDGWWCTSPDSPVFKFFLRIRIRGIEPKLVSWYITYREYGCGFLGAWTTVVHLFTCDIMIIHLFLV